MVLKETHSIQNFNSRFEDYDGTLRPLPAQVTKNELDARIVHKQEFIRMSKFIVLTQFGKNRFV